MVNHKLVNNGYPANWTLGYLSNSMKFQKSNGDWWAKGAVLLNTLTEVSLFGLQPMLATFDVVSL